jgi:hypothetical protein
MWSGPLAVQLERVRFRFAMAGLSTRVGQVIRRVTREGTGFAGLLVRFAGSSAGFATLGVQLGAGRAAAVV